MTSFKKDEMKEDKDEAQDEKLQDYMRQLLTEKSIIVEDRCPFAYRFICEEIDRVQKKLVKGPPRDTRYIDVYHEKPVKISVKVLVPIKEHPRFNFVGKLLGQKGNTLKQLQEETMCYMNICGRGSMRDREKEEELRQSLDPKYAHLSDDLHIEIHTIAPPSEAHTRIASALALMRKYLVPEYSTPEQLDWPLLPKKSILGKVKLDEEEWESPPKRSSFTGDIQSVRHKSLLARPRPRSPITSKSSVMSILNKARIAMEESYTVDYHRRSTRIEEYEDLEENYRPPPKRLMDVGTSYSKSVPDTSFKRRKF